MRKPETGGNNWQKRIIIRKYEYTISIHTKLVTRLFGVRLVRKSSNAGSNKIFYQKKG